MRILLVGSSSVIGEAIAGRISAHGGMVSRAGRRNADYPFDLSRPTELPDIPAPFDVVVHAAADFGGIQVEDIVRAELVNAAGTAAACAIAARVAARQVVLVSSISATFSDGDDGYGAYSLSKRHGEEAARLACATSRLVSTILRPTQVYDVAGACRPHQPLLYHMIDRAQAGQDICLNGRHDPLRNYILLEEFAEVCVRVIERSCAGTYSCPSPRSARLGQIGQAALDAFGKGGSVIFDPAQADLRDLPAAPADDLYERIGFEPGVDILTCMERIRAHRECGP